MKKTLIIFSFFLLGNVGCTLSDPEMVEVLREIKAQNEALQKARDGIKTQLTNLDKNYQKILENLLQSRAICTKK
jgi:hypothetical protein